MNTRLLLLVGLLVPATTWAQYPIPPKLPTASASPLTYVRFTGPEGMEATFYQGRARPRSFPTPTVVGMRPGYTYRIHLGNIASHPGLTIFPTIEVWGNLKLQPRHGANTFPATVHLTPDDVEAVASGSLVTKVIYLEHPDRAEPRATRDGEILEYTLFRTQNLLHEARLRGRVMLVVHLGGRIPTDEEVIRTNVPGTILLPGERVVGPAVAPPCLPTVAKAGEEECLHDGGDRLNPAGFDATGKLGGIEPEDTVAEYRDSRGRRQIVPSNRVCVCVPRFVALRKEIPLQVTGSVLPPLQNKQIKRDVTIADRTPSLVNTQTKMLLRFEGRLRPSINRNVAGPGTFTQLKVLEAQQLDLGPIEAIGKKEIITLTDKQKTRLFEGMKLVKEFSEVVSLAGIEQIQHTSITARVKAGPEIVTANVVVRDLTVCCNEAPIPPDRPLVLIKCADKGAAKPGDVVTFTLRYSNVGGRAMTDVAVTDSLSPRLEYVAGSAEADRDSVFTVQDNEAGSQLLRWEISGTLQPGDTGRIRFQARVR